MLHKWLWPTTHEPLECPWTTVSICESECVTCLPSHIPWIISRENKTTHTYPTYPTYPIPGIHRITGLRNPNSAALERLFLGRLLIFCIDHIGGVLRWKDSPWLAVAWYGTGMNRPPYQRLPKPLFDLLKLQGLSHKWTGWSPVLSLESPLLVNPHVDPLNPHVIASQLWFLKSQVKSIFWLGMVRSRHVKSC